MTTIKEQLTVLCPFDQIPQAAASYASSLKKKGGKSVVALRVHVGDVIVERNADLVLAHHSRAAGGREIMMIEFQAHDGGLYPTFRGTLSVEDKGGNYCHLDLDGSYTPPLGIAGAMFDAVAGHRIASAAVRELLDDIRIGFELAFQTGKSIV